MHSITSVENAIRIYYSYPELNTKQINELFGGIAPSTATKYKNAAKALQKEKGIKTMSPYAVHTKTAYEAWHIDIDELEANYRKLIKLKMISE